MSCIFTVTNRITASSDRTCGDFSSDTLEFLRPLARQKEMHIDWRPANDAVFIPADASCLQQAFYNLALNAFRAMQPHGTLSVSFGKRLEGLTSKAVVDFADQGTGIRAENLAKIY